MDYLGSDTSVANLGVLGLIGDHFDIVIFLEHLVEMQSGQLEVVGFGVKVQSELHQLVVGGGCDDSDCNQEYQYQRESCLLGILRTWYVVTIAYNIAINRVYPN